MVSQKLNFNRNELDEVVQNRNKSLTYLIVITVLHKRINDFKNGISKILGPTPNTIIFIGFFFFFLIANTFHPVRNFKPYILTLNGYDLFMFCFVFFFCFQSVGVF